MNPSSIHPDRLIGALYGLDSAPRAALELRYLHGVSVDRLAELLDCAPSTVQRLLEDGVEGMVLALDLHTLDQGVTLILILTELPSGAWGDRPAEEAITRVREELDRRSASGGAQRRV